MHISCCCCPIVRPFIRYSFTKNRLNRNKGASQIQWDQHMWNIQRLCFARDHNSSLGNSWTYSDCYAGCAHVAQIFRYAVRWKASIATLITTLRSLTIRATVPTTTKDMPPRSRNIFKLAETEATRLGYLFYEEYPQPFFKTKEAFPYALRHGSSSQVKV